MHLPQRGIGATVVEYRGHKSVLNGDVLPLGTVCPLYRTGVLLLSRERFLYI